MNKTVVVIGSGFAGMSAACFMAKAGWDVTVVEKNSQPGGRGGKLEAEGFTFDMGPSWYWMPDVFDRFFELFGKKTADFYLLKRLDPGYRVYWEDGSSDDITADYNKLKLYFESIEKGAGKKLDSFLEEAAYKYNTGINKLVFKPGFSIAEFLDKDVISGVFKLDVFSNMKTHVGKYFTHPKLRQMLEFPVLFLGALPERTPALYSLMNYADIKGGTWYPMGGMYTIAEAMHKLAGGLGVKFVFNETITEIQIENGKATGVKTQENFYKADVVISGADYHFTEMNLLQEKYRTYTEAYWQKRTMAPSCLLFYVGLNKKLKNVVHHSLFFDADFEQHGKEIYTNPAWPANPLFYVSATSVTDASTAPQGCENLFFLVPLAAGLQGDTEKIREKYFDIIVKRFEEKTGQSITSNIIYKKSFCVSDFISEYNSFKGNAYGLANTLRQTAILKPRCRSKKVKNLFYTGQLTVPGPGVPPSLISGEVVSKEILKRY